MVTDHLNLSRLDAQLNSGTGMGVKVMVEDLPEFCAMAEDCGLLKTQIPVRYNGYNCRVFVAQDEHEAYTFVALMREVQGSPFVSFGKPGKL